MPVGSSGTCVPKTLPGSVPELRALADVHGGYRKLFRWGAHYFGMTPLLRLAEWRLRLTGAETILITGTQGKTTTTRAVRRMLGLPLDVWGEANSNTRGEVPWTVLRERPGVPLIPVEVGDGINQLEDFAAVLHPRVSVVLNVGNEHLYLLETLEAVSDELATVITALPADGIAVLNHDDERVRVMATQAPGRVIWFGRAEGCDVRIVAVGRGDDAGIWVDLDVGGEIHRITTGLVGSHYGHVIAATVATGLAAGLAMPEIVARLTGLPPTPSRLEPMRSTRGALIFSDDFKATPETVHAGLDELSAWPAPRRWAVIGDLTNVADDVLDDEYAEVASHAGMVADEVVTVGPEWAERRHLWDGLPTRARHFETFGAATAAVAEGHDGADVIYVKGCEDTKIRRISLALTGRDVICAKVTCKVTHLRCEDCSQLTR